jgi:MoxR-like ATPase
MTSEIPVGAALVSTLRRFFEHDATRNEVRVSVQEACMEMHAAGAAPQTMLVTLKRALQMAALEARIVVSRDDLRAANSDLTPWMIEVCFNRPRNGLR